MVIVKNPNKSSYKKGAILRLVLVSMCLHHGALKNVYALDYAHGDLKFFKFILIETNNMLKKDAFQYLNLLN